MQTGTRRCWRGRARGLEPQEGRLLLLQPRHLTLFGRASCHTSNSEEEEPKRGRRCTVMRMFVSNCSGKVLDELAGVNKIVRVAALLHGKLRVRC
jgi:hypothetical protein